MNSDTGDAHAAYVEVREPSMLHRIIAVVLIGLGVLALFLVDGPQAAATTVTATAPSVWLALAPIVAAGVAGALLVELVLAVLAGPVVDDYPRNDGRRIIATAAGFALTAFVAMKFGLQIADLVAAAPVDPATSEPKPPRSIELQGALAALLGAAIARLTDALFERSA